MALKLLLDECSGICSIVGRSCGGKSLLLAYICKQIIDKAKVKQKIAYIHSNQLDSIGFLRNKVKFYERDKYILSSDVARNRISIVSGEKSMIEEKSLRLVDHVDCIDFNNIRSINELELLINKLIDHGYKNIFIDDLYYLISVCTEYLGKSTSVRVRNNVLRKVSQTVMGKTSIYITVQAKSGEGRGINLPLSETYFSNRVLEVSIDKGCIKIILLKDRYGQLVNQAMYIPINKNFSFKDRVDG